MDKGCSVTVDVIFLDFQKAFDKVLKTRLLQKLSAYGIEGKVLCWIADFLSDRKMRIMVRGEYSEWVDYGQSHDILFNDGKTVCMYMPANSSFYINTPAVFLNGRRLSFTVKYKYLGTLMTHDGLDEANLSRERGFFLCAQQWFIKKFQRMFALCQSYTL